MAKKSLNVNGKGVSVTFDDPDMPLLYALRDNLGLHGPRFGCGLGQCGACTVHVDGKAVRSCVTPLVDDQRQAEDRHARRPRHAREAASGAEGLHRGAGGAVRLLHQRHDHGVGGLPRQQQEAERGRDQEGARQQSLPLRHPCPHRARGQARRRRKREGGSHEHPHLPRATCSRAAARSSSASRSPVRSTTRWRKAPRPSRVALTEVDSFLAIDARPARCTVYSGKVDLGTGVTTALRQIVAEELDVPLSRVELVAGRHDAHARPGQDLGQPHHPDRRHADPQGGRHRAPGAAGGSRQAPRRRSESSPSPTASSPAAASA